MRQTAPSGIIPRKYKSGSIIYFEQDKSEYIYILKTGRVILTSVKLDTGEEVKEDVRQGEFFGVKSSLGKYPREETAQVIGDTEVLIMNPSDFERLILRNVNVVMKMLRVFSNQLRRIHKTVRSVLGEEGEIKPDVELFKIAEYYYKAGSYQHARYAYKRFLEYYPDQSYAKSAMERIKSIDSGQVASDVPDFTAPAPKKGPLADEADDFSFDEADGKAGGEDMVDFDEEKPKRSRLEDSDDLTPLSSEMDDFLTDGGGDQGLDDFSLDDIGKTDSSSLANDYSKAKSMMDSGKYADALVLLKAITSGSKPAGGEDKKAYESAHIDAGVCYAKQKKLKEALDSFSETIKKFPGTVHEKNAYCHIGAIFESANKPDKAISYYSKVLNMEPKDEITTQAMKKIRELQKR